METGVRPMLFFRKHMNALSLYHDMNDMKKIVAAGESKAHEVPQELRRVCAGSKTAQVLLAKLWVKAVRVFFLDATKKQIQGLIDHNFDVDEVTSARKIMKTSAADLVAHGHKKFEKVNHSTTVRRRAGGAG